MATSDEGESTEDRVIPYRFPDTIPAGSLVGAHDGLAPGDRSGTLVTVAGRLMRHRPQGRVDFADLRDWSGTVQLVASEDETADFASFTRLSLGDWVGATGEVMRTRRGELSVAVQRFELLAKARQGFGDKWKGVNDVDLRYRQREVDLWANEGTREVFLRRSRLIAHLRAVLAERGFVEVETPILQPLAGGAIARPFITHFNSLHADFYLRIAPELYLKRLVVGGFERVFEIARVFRNEGLSPRHNPEFTMLEAYQAYVDYLDMAELIEVLVSSSALELCGSMVISVDDRELDLTPPWRRAALSELIEEVTGTACEVSMGTAELVRIGAKLGLELDKNAGPGKLVYEIYEKTTEQKLWGPIHVMDYPAEVSPLSRRHRDKPQLAERLTPVIAGREIGEAYSELVDPDEQRSRFVEQQRLRAAGDEEAMSLDEDFLRALEHGMPPTGGIGIGIDRLAMVLMGLSNIREVLLFPALRRESGRDASEEDEER